MSDYINEEKLKQDTLEIKAEDLEERTEELAGKLMISQLKLSQEAVEYKDVVKFCDTLLQLKAIEEYCDQITNKQEA